ncbi:MAG: hypothetical protein V4481_04795 [Patescibacteria group bacterium]
MAKPHAFYKALAILNEKYSNPADVRWVLSQAAHVMRRQDNPKVYNVLEDLIGESNVKDAIQAKTKNIPKIVGWYQASDRDHVFDFDKITLDEPVFQTEQEIFQEQQYKKDQSFQSRGDKNLKKRESFKEEKKPEMAAHLLAGALALGSLGSQAKVFHEETHYSEREKQKTIDENTGRSGEQEANRARASKVNDFFYSARNFKSRGFAKALKILGREVKSNEELEPIISNILARFKRTENKVGIEVLENILSHPNAKEHIEKITGGIKIKPEEGLQHADHDLRDEELVGIKVSQLVKGQGVKRPIPYSAGTLKYPENAYAYDLPQEKKQKTESVPKVNEQKAESIAKVNEQKAESIPKVNAQQEKSNTDIPPDSGPAAASQADPTVNPVYTTSKNVDPRLLDPRYDLNKTIFYREKPFSNLMYLHSENFADLERGLALNSFIKSGKMGDLIQKYPYIDFSTYRKGDSRVDAPGKAVYQTDESDARIAFQKQEAAKQGISLDPRLLENTVHTPRPMMLHEMLAGDVSTSEFESRDKNAKIAKDYQFGNVMTGKITPEEYANPDRTIVADEEAYKKAGPEEPPESNKDKHKKMSPEELQNFNNFRRQQAGNPKEAEVPFPNIGAPIPQGPLPPNSLLENYRADASVAPPVDTNRAFWQMGKDAGLGVASAVAAGAVGSQFGLGAGVMFHNAISNLIQSVNLNDPNRGFSEQAGSQLFYELEKGLLKGFQTVNPLSEANQILAPLLVQTEGSRTSVSMQDVFARGLTSRSGVNQAQRSFQNWYQDFQTPFAVNSGQGQPPLPR